MESTLDPARGKTNFSISVPCKKESKTLLKGAEKRKK